MRIAQSTRMSWRAIRDHALRSVLTTLGIVIGVAAVIAFVTLGASLQAAIVGDITAGAEPTIEVSAGPEGGGGGPPGSGGSVPVFTDRDLEELRTLPNVATVAPRGTIQIAGMERDGRTVAWQQVTATTPDGIGGSYAAGGPFAEGEREVVLNEGAAALFEPNASVGERIAIRFGEGHTEEVTVVGILETPEGGGFFGGSGQARVFVPTDPFYRTTVESPATGTEQRAYPSATVTATEYEHVPTVRDDVEAYLEERSDARELAPSSYVFTVQTNEQLVEQIQSAISRFTGFVTGIAVIALVVGAIGIANVMLVSVTERTREIGVMRAVGAQERDVLQLFLVEAAILGGVGSAIGAALGVGVAALAAAWIDLPFTVAPEAFLAAIAMGIGVGVVSGLYPAWRAARVDPIVALRRE